MNTLYQDKRGILRNEKGKVVKFVNGGAVVRDARERNTILFHVFENEDGSSFFAHGIEFRSWR